MLYIIDAVKSLCFKVLLKDWCQDKDQVTNYLIHSDKVSYDMEKVYWKSLQHCHPTGENLKRLTKILYEF